MPFNPDLLDATRKYVDVLSTGQRQNAILVSLSWLTGILRARLSASGTGTNPVDQAGFPTVIQDVAMSHSISLDPADVSLDEVLDGSGTAVGVQAVLGRPVVTVALHIVGKPKDVLCEVVVSYDEIRGDITLDELRLAASISAAVNATSQLKIAPGREALIAQWTADRVRTLERSEAELGLLLSQDIAASIVEALYLPDLGAAFAGISFVGRLHLGVLRAAETYLVVSGQLMDYGVDRECPRSDAGYRIKGSRGTVVENGPTHGGGTSLSYPVHISAESFESTQYSGAFVGATAEVQSPLYLYTTKEKVEGLVLPSVTLGIHETSENNSGLVQSKSELWGVVRLAPVVLETSPLLRLKIDAAVEAQGEIKAWVKIGCVRVQIFRGQIDSTVDAGVGVFPVLGPDLSVWLDAVPRFIRTKSVDVEIDTPFIPWPLEEIVEHFVEAIASIIVPTKLRALINSFQLRLADLKRLGLGGGVMRRLLWFGDQAEGDMLLGFTADEEVPKPEQKFVKVHSDG